MSTTNGPMYATTSIAAPSCSLRPPDKPILVARPSRRRPADTNTEYKPLTQHRVSYDDLANTKRELINKNLELERMNEEKSQLLAMAAHDLRSPIGNILIFSELLQEEADQQLTGEQKELLNSIHSSSEFLQRLLDSVFDISVMESDASRLSFELQNPQEILERVVSLSRAFANSRQIQMVLFVDGPIPRINLDPGKLERVFNNLIGNAIKYSQRGASIEVRISAQIDGVLISVRDNGPGIPPEDFKNLFTPFQKTRARAAEPSGGLGLAIAKRMVTRHRGQIWAESKVGLGSTFYVRLPILPDPAESEDLP